MNAMKNGDRATRYAPRRAPAERLLILAVVALLGAGSSAADDDDTAAQADRPDVSAELRKVAEGYLSNRGSFKSFRCEFRYRVGLARDLTDALKNGPTLKPLTATCKWLIDGKRICYTRVLDKEAKAALEAAKANPRPHTVAGQPGFIAQIPISGLGYLTDGTRALRYSPGFVANLMGPRRIDELIADLSPSTTPWALGGLGVTMGSNPGRWILDGKMGTWRFVGERKADDGKGRRLIVECKRESARLTYWLDPQRGFLPARRDYRLNDGRMTRHAITDFRQPTPGRWFPGRVVTVSMRAGGEVWRVQEILLTALDAKTKVNSEDLHLILRRGTQINHVDDLRTAFRIAVAERIGIDDLAALHVRCNEAAARRR